MANLLLTLGILSLVVGGFFVWLGATGIAPGLEIGSTWRIVFGLFGILLLADAVWFTWESGGRLIRQRPIRRHSDQGDLLISPKALRQLVAGILEREFGLKSPRVELANEDEGLKIHVAFHLPPGEELPSFTSRIRETLTKEVERRTGIPVLYVDLSVHRIVHAPHEDS